MTFFSPPCPLPSTCFPSFLTLPIGLHENGYWRIHLIFLFLFSLPPSGEYQCTFFYYVIPEILKQVNILLNYAKTAPQQCPLFKCWPPSLGVCSHTFLSILPESPSLSFLNSHQLAFSLSSFSDFLESSFFICLIPFIYSPPPFSISRSGGRGGWFVSV